MPGARRATEWVSKDVIFTSLTSASQQTQNLYRGADVAWSVKGSTVTRILLDFEMRPSVVAQVCRIYWGIVIVNADAVAALVFPDADDMTERSDWLARGMLTATMSDVQDSSQWKGIHRDLRAQRVMRAEDDELRLVVDAGSDGFTMTWRAMIRTLVKLP